MVFCGTSLFSERTNAMLKKVKTVIRCIKTVLRFVISLAVFSLIIGILIPAQASSRKLLYVIFIISWFGYRFLCIRKPNARNLPDVITHALNTLKALWREDTPAEREKETESDALSQAEEQPQAPQKPKTYNIAAWYGIIAKSTLTDCITELNVRQIKTVSLLENGDLVYGENNEKAGKIESIPSKNCWMDICHQLEDDGLSAVVDLDRILISWE